MLDGGNMRFRIPALALLLAFALAATPACTAAGRGGKAAAARPGGEAVRLPATVQPTAPEPVTQVPDEPVTHLGRTVIPRTDLVVLGRVAALAPLPAGAELARVEATEVLLGDPDAAGRALRVLSASTGVLPGAGTDAVFFLARLEGATNHELVQVAPLADAEAPERLEALRTLLAIEATTSPADRQAALLSHLRAGVVDERPWTRWNAAREYAAFAEARPEALDDADRDALEKALASSRDRRLRELLSATLAVAGGGSGGATLPPPAGAPRSSAAESAAAADIAALEQRLVAAGTSSVDRRSIVVDAAVRHGAAGRAVFARALDDPDPAVREAGAAAVGQLDVAELEPRMASLLTSEPSLQVRRTVVTALGYLRSTASVPTLALLAGPDSAFAREALFALARIRSPDALARLEELRLGARDPERRSTIEFLLSERFVEQERTLREAH